MKKMIGLIATLMITACAGTSTTTGVKTEDVASVTTKPTATDNSFYQHWVNSREEQTPQSGNIFRPAESQAFPQGGFRMAFTFDPSGECNYMDVRTSQMRSCVYTKIGKEVYLYDSKGASLDDLGFTIRFVNATEMRIVHNLAKTTSEETQP